MGSCDFYDGSPCGVACPHDVPVQAAGPPAAAVAARVGHRPGLARLLGAGAPFRAYAQQPVRQRPLHARTRLQALAASDRRRVRQGHRRTAAGMAAPVRQGRETGQGNQRLDAYRRRARSGQGHHPDRPACRLFRNHQPVLRVAASVHGHVQAAAQAGAGSPDAGRPPARPGDAGADRPVGRTCPAGGAEALRGDRHPARSGRHRRRWRVGALLRAPSLHAHAGCQPAAQDRRRSVLRCGRAPELGPRLPHPRLPARSPAARRQNCRRRPDQPGRGRHRAPLSGTVSVELQPPQAPGRRTRPLCPHRRMSAAASDTLWRPSLLPVWFSVGMLWLLHRLPQPLQDALGNILGGLLALLPGKRRHVVATNLALCFPDTPKRERDRWLRQTYQASMRAVLEHGRRGWGSGARQRRQARNDNPDAEQGKGKQPENRQAPHFVGLDMGGVRLSMDRQVASMYAPSKNPASDWLMLRGRSRFHAPVLIAKTDGIKPVLKALKAHLPFYYLPDQDQGRLNAVFVPFFGIQTATLSALPRLAKLTGAQIVPVITRQLPGGAGYRLHCYPPWENFPSDDLEADVARMNAFIEERIREMPPQYLWLHRRFKTRPEGETSLYG